MPVAAILFPVLQAGMPVRHPACGRALGTAYGDGERSTPYAPCVPCPAATHNTPMEASGGLDELVSRVRQDREVLGVLLFGSHARGEAGFTSDVDVCLVVEPGTYEELELSRKKLEYLKYFDLDVQLYQQLPLYIRRRVLKEGKVLFCRDEDQLYRLALRTIQEFEDFRHHYETYLEGISRG